MSGESSFNIDGIETIPSHIKRYIQHLYEKQKPGSGSIIAAPANTNVKVQSKSMINFNVDHLSQDQSSRRVPESPSLTKGDQVTLLANQYLRDLYKSVEIPKTLTTHASTTNFSIQEVPQETQATSESDLDPDDLISTINIAAKKIVTQIRNVMQVNQTNRVNLKTSFLSRQKQYEEQRSRVMKRIKSEMEEGQKQFTYFPKVNSNKDTLFAGYLNRQMQNGHASTLLKQKHQSAQTYQSFRNPRKKYNTKTQNSRASPEQVHDDSKKTLQENGTQTENPGIAKVEERTKTVIDDLHIPIWERVEYIMKCKQQKQVEEAIARKQRREELDEKLFGEKKKNKTRTQVSEFVNEQRKWKAAKEDRILQQRINISDECTFQPSISKKSKSLASQQHLKAKKQRKYLCQQSNGYSFTPTISNKSLELVRNMSLDEGIFSGQCKYTEIRFKTRSTQECNLNSFL